MISSRAVRLSIHNMLEIKPKSMEILPHKFTGSKRSAASVLCQTPHDASISSVPMPQ